MKDIYLPIDVFKNIMSYVGDYKKEKQILNKKKLMSELSLIGVDWFDSEYIEEGIEFSYYLQWFRYKCPYEWDSDDESIISDY